MRGYANLVEPAFVLIRDGPGCLYNKVHARRDRDRAGSVDRAYWPTESGCCCSVVGGVPVAVRRAEVRMIVVPGTAAKDTTTRGRSGGGTRVHPNANIVDSLSWGLRPQTTLAPYPQHCAGCR